MNGIGKRLSPTGTKSALLASSPKLETRGNITGLPCGTLCFLATKKIINYPLPTALNPMAKEEKQRRWIEAWCVAGPEL